MIPVIMAGGYGTRLWPLSRKAYPKQFLALNSEQTLLQETLSRLEGLHTNKPMVICNEEHRFLVAEQLRQQNVSAEILLEPFSRSTAPAVALAALQGMETYPTKPPVLLVLAADHVIQNVQAFHNAVHALLPQVQTGKFGTLGVVPTEAATGYGYIQVAEEFENGIRKVKQFVEKPNFATAQAYIDSGDYLWNSGIFMFRADRYLLALKKYNSKIFDACCAAFAAKKIDRDFIRIDSQNFNKCPEDSIDYSIMEPLCNDVNYSVLLAPLNAGWSDVGSWSSLWKISNKDSAGNAIMTGTKITKKDVIIHDSENCLVSAHSKLVSILGVKDLVVVDTDDALLIAHYSSVQDVKKIVTTLINSNRSEHQIHRVVYRPWGKYDTVDMGKRYQVKRITVNPGAKLSLQMHHHRAEHWIVVKGTAKVTNGDTTMLLTENQSTYIPIGQLHCLENPGVIPLEMIEVQSGGYLGEDDIIRFGDEYGRC